MFDRTLAPEGKHVVSMFTQWVPHEWAAEPHRDELDAYADRVIDQVEAVAPGFRDSILHRQVIGPYDMEHTYGLLGGNIFHGELSPAQLFHMRPAPGYADYRTPIRNLYQASSANPRRRRGHRDPRAQGRRADPPRPQGPALPARPPPPGLTAVLRRWLGTRR